MAVAAPTLADQVVAWQRAHGRNDLPWQGRREPYHVWLSEIMLQQTTVKAVAPYFLAFTARWPDGAPDGGNAFVIPTMG